MSAIPPALPMPPQRQQGATPPAIATTTSEVPPAIAELPAASVIEALVTAAPARGQLVLQTPLGQIAVKLAQQIPLNTTLKLMVTLPGEQPQFRVLNANAPLPQGTGATPGAEPAQGGPAQGGAPPAAAPGSAAANAAGAPPGELNLAELPPLPGGGGSVAPLPGLVNPGRTGPVGPIDAALPGPLDELTLEPPPAEPPMGPGLTALLLRPEGTDLPAGTRFTVRVLSLTPGPPDAAIPRGPASPPQAGSAQSQSSGPASPPAGGANTAAGPAVPAPETLAEFIVKAEAPGPLVTIPAAKPGPAAAPAPDPATAPAEPQPQASPGTAAAPPTLPGGPTPPPAGSAAAQPQPPPAAPQPLTEEETPFLQAEPQEVAPPPANAAPPPAPSLPPLLDGIVTRNSLAGAPLVRTGVGLITIGPAPDLTPGTRVLFATEGTPTLPPAVQAEAAAAPLPQTSTLASIMQAVRAVDPAAAEALIARLPQPGPNFVPSAVLLVSAMQSGDVRAWLGSGPTRALEKAGRRDLIEQLGRDFGEMRNPVTLPNMPASWQVLSLPMLVNARIEPIRLTVRRPPKDDDEASEREEEGLRFLVDVEMSRLGPIQLDGLIKRKSKRFDLILRSRLGMAGDARADIGVIFSRALEGLNMTGQVLFQQSTFVKPVTAPRAGARMTI